MDWRKVVTITSILIIEINGHQDPNSSDLISSSDDMEREAIRRNIISPREWQYEGLPIEFPARRLEKNETTTKRQVATTIATTTVNPPNNHRYRRIYSADEVTTIEEYPFLAALLVNTQLWCGAVILGADTVLTAAHCLQLQYNNRFFREYIKMLGVRVGSTNATSGGHLYRVSEIFFHPNYKPSTLEFNFAVLKLHKNISFEKTRAVAKIDYSRDRIVPTESEITFLGWGSVLGIGGLGGQVLLQKVQLPVYDLADCQDAYGRDLVTRNNFCGGYITKVKNVCNHDAGGPAVVNGRLVGILSFSSKRCDVPDQPAVFSIVGAAVPWIEALGDKRVKMIKTDIRSSK